MNVIIEKICIKVSVREFLGYMWMFVVVVVIFSNFYLRDLKMYFKILIIIYVFS